jgi:hypothetical protein
VSKQKNQRNAGHTSLEDRCFDDLHQLLRGCANL